MKKIFDVMLCLILVFSLVGCGKESSGYKLMMDGTVSNIRISSLPEGYYYELSNKDDIQAITDYFNSLNLIEKYDENPSEYSGMTWVIHILYSDDQEQTIYHFGNMFIKSEDSKWFKMSYEEASSFDTLLSSLKLWDSFSYAEVSNTFKAGDPGVKIEGFVNTCPAPINHLWAAKAQAVNECTIKRNSKGITFVIHHANPFQRYYEEDILERHDDILGHYRIS